MTDAWSGLSNYSGGNLPARGHNRLQERNPRYGKPRNRSEAQLQERDAALKLANHFQARGMRSDALETTHPNILRHHAMMAGVYSPSENVWSMTHRLLRYSEEGQAET